MSSNSDTEMTSSEPEWFSVTEFLAITGLSPADCLERLGNGELNFRSRTQGGLEILLPDEIPFPRILTTDAVTLAGIPLKESEIFEEIVAKEFLLFLENLLPDALELARTWQKQGNSRRIKNS